ncbi:DUF6683 family protein [Archangium sp.]|uniref:DUF6683 family protein n=1 Tax=Archangium sp. TaxID=1872627 RepID=UPI002D60B19A|nr:DUF6683 family protein [Archangium sp.]HYO58764.1 DUF6683 family protein [Archangium sp.]
MNGFSRAVSVFVAGCILLSATGHAGAQPFGAYRQYSSDLFIHGNFKPSFQRQWRANNLRAQGKDAGEATLSPELLPLAVSSFRTVGNPVMPRRLAAGVRELDAAHRQELEGALLKLLKDYEQLLAQHDEQQLKNNLAGAFNFLFVSSYYVLKNGQELSDVQQKSMLEQINAGIALGLKERRLSDRDKQELYESVVLSGTIIRGLYNEGRDKERPEQMKTARDLAKELLEQMMGIAVDKVRVDGSTVRID